MGIDDLIPEDTKSSTSRSSSSNTGTNDPSEDQELKSIGSEPYDKHFTEGKWEEVKRVIRTEFGMNVNEVLNNKTAEERYDILHEAVTFNPDIDEDVEYVQNERCPVCDSAVMKESTVEFQSEQICVHHTIAQVDKALNDGNGS